MLLGAFPFEHSPGSAADEQRAFNEVHFEQIRIHWTENPRNKDIVKHMSPECVDLLDRIFQLNESKRIKIPEIRQHPWFTAPMSSKYAGPMEAINKEQEGLLHLMEKSKVRMSVPVYSTAADIIYYSRPFDRLSLVQCPLCCHGQESAVEMAWELRWWLPRIGQQIGVV